MHPENYLHTPNALTAPLTASSAQVDRPFLSRYGYYMGKVFFATTYEMGHAFPEYKRWVKEVNVVDPLYCYVLRRMRTRSGRIHGDRFGTLRAVCGN